MKKLITLFSVLACVPTLSHAYDPGFIAQHIRKSLNLDMRTQIDVSTHPEPSGFGNLMYIPVTVNGSPFQIFLSKDEKKYIWGYPMDLTVDPDAERAAVINLKNVHSKGPASAPVTLVEYSDLECAHCQKAHEMIKNYSDPNVRFVFKHFPLNGHYWADEAAEASECAAEQKEAAFWSMTDYFFENSVRISTANVKSEGMKAAKSLGLDMDRYTSCVSSGRMAKRVQDDKKEGARAGVNSTPSFFVNGRMVRGIRTFDDLRIVIDEKFREAKQKK